ncbi:uncharacterized protein LOC131656614 [Vicia villosa]|uniref:uncharacterized protein LOC131656614 n=1 Tax=Vicia villosa TaxID=3911 RepID=UPI00273B0D97|nr:uncharacterized protein LOC131656614 [Vicia villosa]
MLHINDDLAKIKEFFNSIPKLGLGDTSMSQLSQTSGNSQMTPYDKFMLKAVVLPLCDIIKLNTTTQCVTVGKIKRLKAAQGGWYYLACYACPKFAKGNQPPYVCSAGHSTETEILRILKLHQNLTLNLLRQPPPLKELRLLFLPKMQPALKSSRKTIPPRN